jgi:hypothetical protein
MAKQPHKDVQPDKQPLEMSQLLSVPIAALMRAQLAAQVQALGEFVETAFEPVKGKSGVVLRARQLEFEFESGTADPTVPGASLRQSTMVRAPVASLIRPLPMAIDTAELEYRFVIAGSAPGTGGRTAVGEKLPSYFAAFTSNNAQMNSSTPTVSVKLTMKARAAAEGMARVGQMFADSISAQVEPDAKTGGSR